MPTRVRGDAFYARWFTSDGPNAIVFGKDSLKWQDRELARL